MKMEATELMEAAKLIADRDREDAHGKADAALCFAIRELANEEMREQAEELIAIFNSFEKWYA